LPNLVELADIVADALELPRKSAQWMARLGRDAGCLSTGGRGRHVPKATSQDAANLIIAMMVCSKAARAPEYMQDFGDLLLFPEFTTRPEQEGEFARRLFVPKANFRGCIAGIIDLLGSIEYARTLDIDELIGGDFAPADSIVPPIDLTIQDTTLRADITFEKGTYGFQHADLADLADWKAAGPVFWSALGASSAVMTRYKTAVKSRRRIECDVLLKVAAGLHGHSFVDLLVKAGGEKVLKRDAL
jgi:hypothetical protein